MQLAAAVGASPVVVGFVFGQDRPQVSFAEDQHPVGDLGPGGEHEPFGIGVGPHRQRHHCTASELNTAVVTCSFAGSAGLRQDRGSWLFVCST
jgi:hypothetical protein